MDWWRFSAIFAKNSLRSVFSQAMELSLEVRVRHWSESVLFLPSEVVIIT